MLELPSSASKQKNYRIAVLGLLLTLGLGILLRLTYAGYGTQLLSLLDIRRAHTHLGFYVFLFPILWLHWEAQKAVWVPKGRLLVSYYIVSYLAVLSFLFLSYEWPSKFLSFFVLLYWFAFSIKNLKTKVQPWFVHSLYGILLASLCVLVIAVFGAIGRTDLAKILIRVFMTFLLWGVFVPLSLSIQAYRQVPIFLWFIFLIGTGIFVSGLFSNALFFWGPIGLGLSLVWVLCKSARNYRFNLYWLAVSLGLILLGMGLVKNTHATAVAGIHLVVLGPILQSIFSQNDWLSNFIYDLFVYSMVLFIVLIEWSPNNFRLWQVGAAYSGVGLALVLLWQIFKEKAFYKNGSSSVV